MIVLPIVGAFFEAAGTIIEKKILRNRKINYKNYTVLSFLFISIFMGLFIYFVWRVDSEAMQIENILIMAVIIIVSILANLFIFYSLKREDISEFEPAWIMQPLFVVLLAVLLYRDERNWIIVVLALIASLTLILSHVKKKHLYFNKYLLAAVIGSFLFAVELVLSKLILPFYSPFSLYFIRCLFIFIITYIIYRPKMKDVKGWSGMGIAVVGMLWVFYRAIIYYGYEKIGIVYTTMLFILSPVLMLLFAGIFLKERPTLRQIASTAIILLCVVASVILMSG